MENQFLQKITTSGKSLVSLLTTALLFAFPAFTNGQSVSFGVEFGTPQSNGGPCVGKGSCDQAFDFDITTGVYISSPDAVTCIFTRPAATPVAAMDTLTTSVVNIDSLVPVGNSAPAVDNVLIMRFSMTELTQKQPDQVAYFTDPSQTYPFDAAYSLTGPEFGPLGLLPNAVITPTDETDVAIDGDVVTVTIHYSYSAGKGTGNTTVQANTTSALTQCTLGPNPVNDMLTLNINSDSKVNHFNIVNLFGQVVNENAVAGATTNINVSNLPSGMYMVNLFEGSAKTQTIKFVKQ